MSDITDVHIIQRDNAWRDEKSENIARLSSVVLALVTNTRI